MATHLRPSAGTLWRVAALARRNGTPSPDRPVQPVDQLHALAEQFGVGHSLRHPSLQDPVHGDRLATSILAIFQIRIVDHLSQHLQRLALELEFTKQCLEGAFIAAMPKTAWLIHVEGDSLCYRLFTELELCLRVDKIHNKPR